VNSSPSIAFDFYQEAFDKFESQIINTPLKKVAPRFWQLRYKQNYSAEVTRLRNKLTKKVCVALPGKQQEFYVCCFNYLRRGAPNGLYEGLYTLIGENATIEECNNEQHPT